MNKSMLLWLERRTYVKENTSKAEKIAEKLENGRKPDEELSDDDRDLLEDFMEFLNQKQK